MKISGHKLSKVCLPQDDDKYLVIAEGESGYAKLCCYTVRTLRESNITTSYENICVGMWLMFSKAKRLQLGSFEDMPNTDFMEKLIKLRSKQGPRPYLTGGNYKGKTDEFGFPWQLTAVGNHLADEVAEVLSGEKRSLPVESRIKTSGRGSGETVNYDAWLGPLLESKLFKVFEEASIDEKDEKFVLPNFAISPPMICSALRIYYPSENLKQKVEEQKKLLRRLIDQARTDGKSNRSFDEAERFLDWIDKRGVQYG